MTVALLRWAGEHGTLIGRTALRLRIIGGPGLPAHPRELPSLHYLWLVEDILRDRSVFERGGEELDKIYRAAASRRRPAAVTEAERAAQIAQVLADWR